LIDDNRSMRLRPEEGEAIARAARETLPSGAVYLFGSRTDDARRGGDIDLLIEPRSELPPREALVVAARQRAIELVET
jgi:predicted nucleotidyltransferase